MDLVKENESENDIDKENKQILAPFKEKMEETQWKFTQLKTLGTYC